MPCPSIHALSPVTLQAYVGFPPRSVYNRLEYIIFHVEIDVEEGKIMTNDRSTRTFIAAILLLAAVLVAMNRAVTSASLTDWWLPLLLAVIGIAVAVYRTPASSAASSEEDTKKPVVREYLPSGGAETASLSATSAAVSAPAKPDTTPAPKPSHVAKTEHAEAEQNMATETPPAPPAKKDRQATAKTAPEAEVVAATTASPPQPHETEKMGEVTPETASKVAEGKADETSVAANITKSASRKVAQQEKTGAATPGKPDDLVRIDGIGPKVAAALIAAGVDSFQKLANTSEDRTLEILRDAKVRVVGNYSSWAQQAAYAARGDWEGLDTFNRERKAESS